MASLASSTMPGITHSEWMNKTFICLIKCCQEINSFRRLYENSVLEEYSSQGLLVAFINVLTFRQKFLRPENEGW